MKKVIILISIIICLACIGIGYITLKYPKNPPNITITIGDTEIDYVVGLNEWNRAKYDRADTFHTIMKNKKEIDVPYIELDKSASIRFEKNPPDKLTISDNLLFDNGNGMYTEKDIVAVPFEIKKRLITFDITNHWAEDLSSYYEEGNTYLRGYRIIASWGENECEYAFIIRTDKN